RARVVPAVERVEQWHFHREPQRGEIARVLGFRIDADGARLRMFYTGAHAQLAHRFHTHAVDGLRERHDLFERRHFELAVEACVRRTLLWNALPRAQGFHLRKREILHEPAFDLGAVDPLRSLAVRELAALSHIGGATDLVLMARHERTIP